MSATPEFGEMAGQWLPMKKATTLEALITRASRVRAGSAPLGPSADLVIGCRGGPEFRLGRPPPTPPPRRHHRYRLTHQQTSPASEGTVAARGSRGLRAVAGRRTPTRDPGQSARCPRYPLGVRTPARQTPPPLNWGILTTGGARHHGRISVRVGFSAGARGWHRRGMTLEVAL
jgi:hypothetical protein